MATETLVFPNALTPLDLLLYRRFGQTIDGLAELVLAQNPGLADLGVFPPKGTQVVVPLPSADARQPKRNVIRLYS